MVKIREIVEFNSRENLFPKSITNLSGVTASKTTDPYLFPEQLFQSHPLQACFLLSRAELEGRGSFSIFRKISLTISFYHDPSLIKNFYKATNPPPIIKPTVFCAYDLNVRYSLVFFKVTRLPLIPVEYK